MLSSYDASYYNCIVSLVQVISLGSLVCSSIDLSNIFGSLDKEEEFRGGDLKEPCRIPNILSKLSSWTMNHRTESNTPEIPVKGQLILDPSTSIVLPVSSFSSLFSMWIRPNSSLRRSTSRLGSWQLVN